MAAAVRRSASVTLTTRLCSQRWQIMWNVLGARISRATSWRCPHPSQLTTARIGTLNWAESRRMPIASEPPQIATES